MSEQDKNGFRFDSLLLGVPVALLFVMITIMLFQFKDSITYFKVVLWVGLPLLAAILMFGVNLINQSSSCNTIHAGKALLGSIPSIVTVLIGVAVSSISYCRIPVASVCTPLFIGETVNIVTANRNIPLNNVKNNSKRCCSSTLTLESVESKYPIIAGMDHGFYIMFSILFGFVFGNSIATIC